LDIVVSNRSQLFPATAAAQVEETPAPEKTEEPELTGVSVSDENTEEE
jgi:hypothetical protein